MGTHFQGSGKQLLSLPTLYSRLGSHFQGMDVAVGIG